MNVYEVELQDGGTLLYEAETMAKAIEYDYARHLQQQFGFFYQAEPDDRAEYETRVLRQVTLIGKLQNGK